MNYSKHVSTRKTPQTEPIPGRTDQVQNNAGGYVFAIDKWQQLQRFLILGTEGGTYYCGERELTKDACKAAMACLKEDGERFVRAIVTVSGGGKAKSNDQALFLLAMAAKLGDEPTRTRANAALPRVARIGTHLFHYAKFIKGFGGWGTGQVRSIGRWYNGKEPKDLAYQAVKYQQRDGWSNLDLLRLCHPRPASELHQTIYSWIKRGVTSELPTEVTSVPEAVQIIWAFERAKRLAAEGDVKGVVRLIVDHRLPHEAVPNEVKDKPEVWEALLESMKPEAMVRNLGKMTAIGLLGGLSGSLKKVTETLADPEKVKRARLHPLTTLMALKTYAQGHGMKGKLSWAPVGQVLDALDACFYLGFDAVEPVGKTMCVAVDVSGSMDWGATGTLLTAREVAAALAMVTVRVEKNYEVVGFSHTLKTLAITPRMRLDDVANYMRRVPMGGTDASLPIRVALEKKVRCECFLTITDNETWAGPVQVPQALREYRNKLNVPARLVTAGVTSTGFTIADPTDAGMLDVVGCSTDMPGVISSFFRD